MCREKRRPSRSLTAVVLDRFACHPGIDRARLAIHPRSRTESRLLLSHGHGREVLVPFDVRDLGVDVGQALAGNEKPL
jgi:hypothetical protein